MVLRAITLGLLLSLSINAQNLYPDTEFMVFSDPHYYDPSLGISGPAFERYLEQDRKLLAESESLLKESIMLIKQSNPKFVLIPGDLTKDGTLVSHKAFARHISSLEEAGIKVYVVPGNHDVLNGEAKSFHGEESKLEQNVSPARYESIYKEFGYSEALYKDPNSLSYVVEPVEGIWVLGLDACLYTKNKEGEHPLTGGSFNKNTLEWIQNIAGVAKTYDKQLLAFMHHGITEHYKGQKRFFGDYVVEDFKKTSKLFADLGIKVVFTGHYHSQDITKAGFRNGSFVFDIETGSLVTYPTPLRKVSLVENKMHVSTIYIEKTENHPEGFQEFSQDYVYEGLAGIAEQTLLAYHLNEEDAKALSGQIARAFVEHYEGDEPSVEKYLDMRGIGLMGRIMIFLKRKLIIGLYDDLPPADNSVIIDLDSGEFNSSN